MKKLITILSILTLSVIHSFGVAISADATVGDVVYRWTPGTRGIFETSGSYGSGTLTLYRWIGSGTPTSGSGEWVAFAGGAFTDDGGVEFVTLSSYLSVGLSGATTPSIEYFTAAIKN